MSIKNPTLAHFRHFSSLFTNLPAYKTLYFPAYKALVFCLCRKASCGLFSVFCFLSFVIHHRLNALRCTLTAIRNTKNYVRIYQRNMQNKPNVKDAKMNISPFMTIKYVKLDTWLSWKNKPNPSGLRCLLRSCRTDQTQTNPISVKPK